MRQAKAFIAEMQECWNWQTGMTKEHVSTDVWVQVPSPALKCEVPNPRQFLRKGSETSLFCALKKTGCKAGFFQAILGSDW